MSIIDKFVWTHRFKETVFYKENNDLQEQYDALIKLNEEFPNNKDILSELFVVKKGLEGEEEVSYQLKKAHIGMYVLRDLKFKYEDLSAQIDFIVITPVYVYYIECKNLVGNLTVNDKGDFIREFTYNGKLYKKGMYSPFRQVESQREVLRKIWEKNSSKLTKFLGSNLFEYFRRVLVVVANSDTILNTDDAPKDMKYKIIRADSLIREIEYDLEHRNKDDYIDNKNEMEERAKAYISLSFDEKIDYYQFYIKKFGLTKNDDLRMRLLKLRKSRASKMKIPTYYVFNNDELDKIIELKPRTIEELQNANILLPIKVKIHGKEIIKEINGEEELNKGQ